MASEVWSFLGNLEGALFFWGVPRKRPSPKYKNLLGAETALTSQAKHARR